MILATVTIWVWQAQAIQIDMLFAALLAGSWLAWLGGYLLLRGHAPGRARGGALVLPGRLRRPGPGLPGQGTAGPGAHPAPLAGLPGLAAGLRGPCGRSGPARGCCWGRSSSCPGTWRPASRAAPAYAYEMVVHQNLERALHAWDHIQPPWKYVEYLAADFFPWTLLLPALALFLRRVRARALPGRPVPDPGGGGALPAAELLPEQAGQVPPHGLPVPGPAPGRPAPAAGRGGRVGRSARLGGAAGGRASACPALALAAVACPGRRRRPPPGPDPALPGPAAAGRRHPAAGRPGVAARVRHGEGGFLARETALALGLVFLVLGHLGLPPAGSPEELPELDRRRSSRSSPDARSIIGRRSAAASWSTRTTSCRNSVPGPNWTACWGRTSAWSPWTGNGTPTPGAWTPRPATGFEVLLRMPVGGGEALLLRRRPAPPPP